MSEKAWVGAIYLKDEGGYRIVLKSLYHYKKRLRTLRNSPELKNAAAMFGPVLVQQAARTVPKIDEMIQIIHDCLEGIMPIDDVRDKVPFMEKALACYEADIIRARDSGHDYFVTLVGNMRGADDDLLSIKAAQKKISRFS